MAPSKHPLPSRRAALCLVLSSLSHVVPAAADQAGPAGSAEAMRSSAAAVFDEGVSRFSHAEYAASARAFLRADELMPSNDALRNAITAARNANEHLLVVQAAERVVARTDAPTDLLTFARDAMSEAARSLARVDVRCEPLPCSLYLDEASVAPGIRYVLPGNHSVAASGADQRRTDQSLSLVAGATYTITLHAVRPGEEAHAATISNDAPHAERVAGARVAQPRDQATGSPPRPATRKALSPSVFWIGAGVTAALGGLTVWSGLDTLSARDRLSPRPSGTAVDGVRSKITRSDLLFGSTVAVAALTGLAGLLWVDWGGDASVHTGLAVVPGGAIGGARGRF